jgi:hypothetical protein
MGLEFVYEIVHFYQVHLQTIECRTDPMEEQEAVFYPWFKVQADGSHVANDLVLGFLESKVQAPFTTAAGLGCEVCCYACFPRSRSTG